MSERTHAKLHQAFHAGEFCVMLKLLIKRFWFSLFSVSPFSYAGRLLARVMPQSYIDRVYQDFFSERHSSSLTAKCLRAEVNRRYSSLSDSEIRRLNRETFWGSKPAKTGMA